MASYNIYNRDTVQAVQPPPALAVRYFYTSPLAIDDPLSPVPPPLSSTGASYRVPPRPFSTYDTAALDEAWLDIRRKRLKLGTASSGSNRLSRNSSNASAARDTKRGSVTNTSAAEAKRRSLVGSFGARSIPPSPRHRPQIPESPRNRPMNRMPSNELIAINAKGRNVEPRNGDVSVPSSLRALDPADSSLNAVDTSTVTGNPFIRAPSRSEYASSARSRSASIRPGAQKLDSYNWGDDQELLGDPLMQEEVREPEVVIKIPAGPSAKVPVGVSRLHEVVIPELQMEPIYWSPVNDIASVVRATWFYADTMLPVEVDVANMVEAGYVELQAWSETWKDELKSAVEVGAAGEMKILHKLWPEKPKNVPASRPGTSRGQDMGQILPPPDPLGHDPEKEREEMAANAGDLIDTAAGPGGPDNKAAGAAPYGRDGTPRKYVNAGIIYANEREAYILRQNLQPSVYYGRRPLAHYIHKGRNIGVRVVRGFDQQAWDKIHPRKKTAEASKAKDGVSTSADGISPEERQRLDPTLSSSSRPHVTDLVLVIHGIGQKLSERVESYHFTHSINAFRREANVELGSSSMKANMRSDLGGIMILPVNWRLTLSFEEGGYRPDDLEQDPSVNSYTLQDITPDTLPSVRNIVSDVMLDIPYYLSREHNPKMIAAVAGEANRIYRLWCANNPGFADWGRVHIIAHSLGSVMAIDILSHQPTHVSPHLGSSKTPVSELPKDHFIFDTKSLFVCGSPSGFFLLLKKATLLPRVDRDKPGADGDDTPGVAGEQGTYGCLAIDNIYNVVNPYDPVAYRLNAAVDADYAASLKPAFVPTRTSSWFSNPFTRSSSSSAYPGAGGSAAYKPAVARLPSNVELETHNFTREEIAEKRAYLLNDNGQIDYFLKYGGGALEIQYLTMLGAHSSYWLSRDFVSLIVQEVGRREGKSGTFPFMRAQKKKIVPGSTTGGGGNSRR